MEVRSRPAKGDRLSGKIDVDLLDSGFRLEGPVAGRKDLSFGLSGRRSYIDVLLPLATSVVGGPDASIQPIYWDYQARLDYKKGGTRAGVRMYGYDDVLVLAATDDDAARRRAAWSRYPWWRPSTRRRWRAKLSNRLSSRGWSFWGISSPAVSSAKTSTGRWDL